MNYIRKAIQYVCVSDEDDKEDGDHVEEDKEDGVEEVDVDEEDDDGVGEVHESSPEWMVRPQCSATLILSRIWPNIFGMSSKYIYCKCAANVL